MNEEDPKISVAPGAGLLCARAGELLFVPSGNSDLAEVFIRSHPGELITNVTGYVEEQQLVVDDFAIVHWGLGTRIVLFGAMELTSDLRSLPRMSAAEVGTWVERTIDRHDDMTIGVRDQNIVETTNLQVGTIPAEGFRLRLPATNRLLPDQSVGRTPNLVIPAPAQVSEPDEVLIASEETVDSSALSFDSANGPESFDEGQGHAEDGSNGFAIAYREEPELPVASQTTEIGGLPAAPDTSPPDFASEASFDDLVAASQPESVTPSALEDIAEGSSEDGPSDSLSIFESSAQVPKPTGAAVDLPPPVGLAVDRPSSPETKEHTAVYHATSHQETMTRSREALEAAAALYSGLDAVSSSTSCFLLVEPDQIEPVDEVIIVGRRPKPPGDSSSSTRTVTVSDGRVSGTHLRVEPDGDQVKFTDLGSTNGSFMLASGDGEPIQLQPGEPQSASPGAVVQIGGQRIWVKATEEVN